MAAARKRRAVHEQELTAPDGAVRAESGTVKRHTDRRLPYAVLGKAGCNVCVMMLDGDPRFEAEFRRHRKRKTGARVVRMKIVRDRGGTSARRA